MEAFYQLADCPSREKVLIASKDMLPGTEILREERPLLFCSETQINANPLQHIGAAFIAFKTQLTEEQKHRFLNLLGPTTGWQAENLRSIAKSIPISANYGSTPSLLSKEDAETFVKVACIIGQDIAGTQDGIGVYEVTSRGHTPLAGLKLSWLGLTDRTEPIRIDMSAVKLCYEGDFHGVKSLLQKDKDLVLETDELGHSVLFAAVMGKHYTICELLVASGANVNEQSVEFGFTLLHKACLLGCMEIVRLLINNGADVTAKDPKDNDALYNAITGAGDLLMCKYLVKKGASCEGALHLACFTGKLDVVQWLLDEVAQGTGRASIGRDGVNTKGFRENTALHLACQQGHFEICKLLIQRGADVRAANEVGCTPLHEAVLAENAARITALLIVNGADINARDREDRAPLHKASSMGHLDHCKALIDIGADINILDQSKCQAEHRKNNSPLKGSVGTGDSALHYAILSGSIDMCGYLIDRGIDMRIKSALGKPLVHFACHHKKYRICSLLIERGADVDALDYKQLQVPTGSPKSRKRSPKNSTEEVPMLSITYSETALQAAARAGNTEACRMLLDHGANVNAADEVFGNTPLHIVCQEGFRDICELLLRYRADINVTNRYFDSDSMLNREDTPLHVAAAEGHLDVCQLLVDHNADASICNSFGQDAVAAASADIKHALELHIGQHIIENNSIYDHNGVDKHTVSRDYALASASTLPFSGPERVWKHRKVRFSVKKTIFKSTIWEVEILTLQSAPGQGAWITTVPCNMHTSAITVPLMGIVPVELQVKRGDQVDLRLVFKEESAKRPLLKLSFGTDSKRRSVWKEALLKHIENGKSSD